jgi:zinc transport system substrate-binding protein
VTAKSKILASVMLLVLLATALALGGCSPVNSEKLGVVTSTSLIAQIVGQVGGDRVSVINIIPPAQCPGHFDVKPGDIQKLATADLFLLHGWQGEQFSQEIIASADNPDLTTVQLDIQGNWMTPPVQKEATATITATLCQLDSQNAAVYQQLAAEYTDRISAKETEIMNRLNAANLSAVNVLCADQQADFVSWTGLNVVTTYGTPDSLTPQLVRELVDTGRASGVSLIIDNLQSGQDAGAAIAEELGATRIILSNFPGGFPDTETWEKAIDKNIQLILEATGQ